MGKYVVKRVLLLIPTTFFVCLIVFTLLRAVPGSAVQQVVYRAQQSGVAMTEEMARERLGLDKPAPVQFVTWMGQLLHGDLGQSMFQSDSVGSIIASHLPATLELGIMTLVLTILISVPLGLFCAAHQDSISDNVLRTLSVVLASVPLFWIGALMLVYPAVWWGYSTPIKYVSFFQNPGENLRMFIVPAILGAITTAGSQIRAVRTLTLEVLQQDYIRTAWAKGARERRVLFAHAFRNILIPIITLFGGSVAGLVGGSVVLENMFNIPGIGQQMVLALSNRDYTLVQGTTLVFGLFVMIVNLIVDIAYKWCDPRVELE